MYLLDGNDEWNNIHHDDLWVYNKLFLRPKLNIRVAIKMITNK